MKIGIFELALHEMIMPLSTEFIIGMDILYDCGTLLCYKAKGV